MTARAQIGDREMNYIDGSWLDSESALSRSSSEGGACFTVLEAQRAMREAVLDSLKTLEREIMGLGAVTVCGAPRLRLVRRAYSDLSKSITGEGHQW